MQNWKNLLAQRGSAAGRRTRDTGCLSSIGRLPPKRSLSSTGVCSSLNSRSPPFNQHRQLGGEGLSTRNQSTSRPSLAAKELLAPSRCSSINDDLEDGLEQSMESAARSQWSGLELSLQTHSFLLRHIGPSEQQQVEMLNEIGYSSMDELVEATVPAEIMLNRALRLPEASTETQLLEELRKLANQNEAHEWRSFIGQGFYDCVTPPVIMRNMFENPGWTTAYTAYQAEIAQGRLESLMNYQTMVTEMTGMDVANASLLDEASAAAEALQVCSRFAKFKRNKWLVSRHCHPQTLAVVVARAHGLGVEVDLFDELEVENTNSLKLNDYSGLLLQYPNTRGQLHDFDWLIELCQKSGCLTVIATDLLACSLFKPPGDFANRPDLTVGSSQRLGVPLNYGGPHAAFLACKKELIRYIPGRIVGLTRDSNGNQAYRFALQTREQHIRRDKATSNICTAQALLANMSAMYAVYHGPEGLREIAGSIHAKTSLLAQLLSSSSSTNNGYKLLNGDNFFDTLSLLVVDQRSLRAEAHESKINLRYTNQDMVSISLDETTKLSDVFELAKLVQSVNGHSSADRKHSSELQTVSKDEQQIVRTPLQGNLAHLARTSSFLTHPTFNSHRSEAQIVRYMKHLESKDISLAHSMIPLGSCTMKLNGTSEMIASSWPEFTRCHPFQPVEQCRGYMRLIEQLNDYLCEITGYTKISFQPNSGAQGEYAGLRVIKAYLDSKGQQQRDICLIPVSAHGTNPASAQMAGLKIQTIKVRDDGNIDLDHLKTTIESTGDKLACLMVTYPSTFGVFEGNIRQMCDMVHAAGGQVYLDGANMNAQVGLCRPADYGSDVSHLNLHKTFCIPHGGGGPGVGPIGVREHLVPFLPQDPLAYNEDKKSTSFGSIASSMWGSPAILPISWSYIRLMGPNLKKSSQVAILSANYMKRKLEGAYDILFKGDQGNIAHEFIIDCRKFKKTAGVEAIDIAKRLQDFGLHAPTVSWPVSNTLMIEPTESEDKHQLDRYCDALLVIRQEIMDIESGRLDKQNNPLKNAPHTQQVICSDHWNRPYTREQAAFPASFVNPSNKIWPSVGRVDDAYGDTNLFCTCSPTSLKFN